MTHALNTSRSDYLTYQYEQLHIAIMGGIRLDGLDRMRVTLKIEFKTDTVRHNLDLYNDTQVEKLIRKVAERLEIGTSYVSRAINSLVGELENYRLEENERMGKEVQQIYVLTEQERIEAQTFLQSSDLLEQTGKLIGQAGVVGEELNRLMMYLVFTSRKTHRPLHIVSFGSSGAGKSHLQEKVAELIPEEDKIEITSLTGNAFYYFEKDELGHKLILIEDLDGVLAALYPIRELQSKQKISKTVTVKDQRGNAKTIHLVVYGPVTIAGCTTQERIYEDNANRSFLVYLDESAEQDEKIMDFQRLLSAGKINEVEQIKAKTLLKNSQRLLQPIKVINPYAEFLKIPKEVFKPRRTNAHYIAFIEVITFYKQLQRTPKTDEQTGELYIETTLEDIAQANTLMKHVLLGKADELSGACRTYFEKLKTYLTLNKKQTFDNREIRSFFRISMSSQKRYMSELQQYGYVHKVEGDKKKGFHYAVSSYEEYSALQNKVNSVLDEILEHIKQNDTSKPQEVKKSARSSTTKRTTSNPVNKEKMIKK
jgi:predicted transcriptional regulator